MPIKSRVRTIENYPHQGVMFRDIATLFKDPEGLLLVIDLPGLGGRKRLEKPDHKVFTQCEFGVNR